MSSRIESNNNAIEAAKLGMRIGGGKAYNSEINMERLLRDAFAGQVMVPSTDVLNNMLGSSLTAPRDEQ